MVIFYYFLAIYWFQTLHVSIKIKGSNSNSLLLVRNCAPDDDPGCINKTRFDSSKSSTYQKGEIRINL